MLLHKKVEELYSHSLGTYILKYEHRDPTHYPQPFHGGWTWEAEHHSGKFAKSHIFYYDQLSAEVHAQQELQRLEKEYVHESK